MSAEDIWGDDLTDAQLKLVIESGSGNYGEGFGVELRGAGQWRVARKLEELGLGDIQNGAPNGSELPGLYFNNSEGARIVNEHKDEPDDYAVTSGPCVQEGGWPTEVDGEFDLENLARAAIAVLPPSTDLRAMERGEALAEAARACRIYAEWCEGWGKTQNLNVAVETANECARMLECLPRDLPDDDEDAAVIIAQAISDHLSTPTEGEGLG